MDEWNPLMALRAAVKDPDAAGALHKSIRDKVADRIVALLLVLGLIGWLLTL